MSKTMRFTLMTVFVIVGLSTVSCAKDPYDISRVYEQNFALAEPPVEVVIFKNTYAWRLELVDHTTLRPSMKIMRDSRTFPLIARTVFCMKSNDDSRITNLKTGVVHKARYRILKDDLNPDEVQKTRSHTNPVLACLTFSELKK